MSQLDVTLPFPLPEFDWRSEENREQRVAEERRIDQGLPKVSAPKYLKAYGLKRDSRLRERVVLSLAFVLLVIWVILDYRGNISKPDNQVGTVALGLFALLVGYQQWQEARHEISMDKYYERLDLANRWRENGKGAPKRLPASFLSECKEENMCRMMFIYAELDNLEYVIEKYRLGYMRADQACRGLRTFQQRCRSEEFRRLADKRVGAGDYHATTRRVVKIVCRVANELQAKTGAEMREVA